MTERRRFFPARPVQQVPGQTVGLQVRLRPVAAPAPVAQAAGGDAGDVACTGWLAPWLCGAETLTVETDGGVTEIFGPYRGMASSLWQGTPLVFDEGEFPRPIPGGDFVCTEMDINSSVDAGYLGGSLMAVCTGGAVWEFEWSTPSVYPATSMGGRKVIVAAGVLVVDIPITTTESVTPETLTASAYADGELVMQLVLNVRSYAI